MKKKIFFDATPLISKQMSGVGKVLLETIKAFDTEEYSKKYEVFVFLPFNEVKKLHIENFQYVKIKSLPFHHKFLSLFSRLRVSPPLDLFLGKGVYIFANFRNWNLLYSKSITYIHDIAFKIYPEYIQGDNLRYLERYINLWLKRTSKVVAVSESTKRELEREFSLDDVGVVLNAVDDSMVPYNPRDISSKMKKWSIPKDYYIHVSNIEPRKNLENLINGFAHYVTTNNSNESLVLIGGNGWKNEGILSAIDKARAKGVSIVRPEAYVPDSDLPALFAGAIATVQVSWHEGFGLSLLSSLACGTPAIISNIPSLLEVAKGNEKNVVVVEPADITAIANSFSDIKKIKHTLAPVDINRWRNSAKQLADIIDSL